MTSTWSRALVTGASSGIGRAIASRIAVDGADLVLVARGQDRLEGLARELRDLHRVEVEVLAADLTVGAERQAVEARLAADPPVDLLVNNAGFGSYGAFADLDIDNEANEIELNVVALVRLTHAALPAMIGRGRGWIVNVSSIASLQAMPLHAVYGASKAFVTNFSESLHEEVRDKGVRVTAVLPGYTHTEFHIRAQLSTTNRIPDRLWQSADACAAEALAGARAGKALVVTGRVNQVVAVGSALVPRAAKRRLVRIMSGRLQRP